MDCKDQVKTMEKLECYARKVKFENETIENHYTETFVKLENGVISTQQSRFSKFSFLRFFIDIFRFFS